MRANDRPFLTRFFDRPLSSVFFNDCQTDGSCYDDTDDGEIDPYANPNPTPVGKTAKKSSDGPLSVAGPLVTRPFRDLAMMLRSSDLAPALI